jgi:hypothetical protein
MNWLPLFTIIAVVVLIFYFQKCSVSCKCSRDKFGQDPSIRANAGWVAGPMYGYDPIDKFAGEIDEYKAKFRRKADSIGCGHACQISQDECLKCFQTRETLVIGVMPLDTPPNPKPGYKKREGHPPWVPSEIEFDEDFRGGASCMSCS